MDYGKKILTLLLDKYERSSQRIGNEPVKRSISIKVKETFPLYYDDSTPRYKEEINQAAWALEQQALVQLSWQKHEEGNILEKISLNPLNLDRAYAHVGRVSRTAKEQACLALLQSYVPALEPWGAEFVRELSTRIKAGKGIAAYVNLDDLAALENVLKVLRALPQIQEEIPKRVFSLQVLQHSKALEQVENTVSNILREFHPALAGWEEGAEGQKSILAEFGIVESPQYVYLHGPLKIRTSGREADLNLFRPAIGLPVELLKTMELTDLGATVVLSVENLTSFYQLAKAAPPKVLIIYLGGYHNRYRRELFFKLQDYCLRTQQQVCFAHWGDIDYGGFSILAHLRQKTGLPIRAVGMDEAMMRQYLALGSSFTKSYGKRLADLLQKPAFEEFYPTIRYMLEKGVRLEQEAIEIAYILQKLQDLS